MALCRNGIQHNDTQHNGTQNKRHIWDTKHKWHSAEMAFSITTLSIMALIIKGLFGTLSINGTLQKRHSAYLHQNNGTQNKGLTWDPNHKWHSADDIQQNNKQPL
jgi:hypothetical protein